MVEDEEQSFALEVVQIALFGGHDKNVAVEGLGRAGKEVFFYGDGGAVGGGRQFHHAGDGAEVMVSWNGLFVVGVKEASVPEYRGVGTDGGEGQHVLPVIGMERYRQVDAYMAFRRDGIFGSQFFYGAVLFYQLYGNGVGDPVFAVAGAVCCVEGIGNQEKKKNDGNQAECIKGFFTFRTRYRPLFLLFHLYPSCSFFYGFTFILRKR